MGHLQKTLQLISYCGVFCWLLAASTQKPDQDLKQLAFHDYAVDFGVLKRGEKRQHVFKFTNYGENNVSIVGIHAPCTCTIVKVSEGAIKPGEDGELLLEFDSSNHGGRIVKTILVVTSEPIISERILTVKAEIQDEFVVSPPVLDFGQSLLASLPKKQSLTITPMKIPSFKIHKLTYNKQLFDANFEAVGKDIRISVTLKKGAASGAIREIVSVHNNSQHLPRLDIPVIGQIQNRISFAPEYLDFGHIDPAAEIYRSLELTSDDQFAISSVQGDLMINGEPLEDWRRYVEVDVSEQKVPTTSKNIGIKVKNLPGAPMGALHGQVYFYTLMPDERIAVEIYGLMAQPKTATRPAIKSIEMQ